MSRGSGPRRDNVMDKEGNQLDSHTVGIYRTAATVKGGRRFSFGALVVVGNRRGRIGYGYAKGTEVPTAIQKAQKQAGKSVTDVATFGTTIPHEVEGRFQSSTVRLIPASPGTGVVAGGTVRAVLEHAGITDCMTKCYGSTNPRNVVRAVLDGLNNLKSKALIEELRGIEIEKTITEEKVEAGQRFMPAAKTATPKTDAAAAKDSDASAKSSDAATADSDSSKPADDSSGAAAGESAGDASATDSKD